MRTRLLVVSFLLAATGALGACEEPVDSFTPVRQHGIINGEVAAEGQFPSVVALGGAFGGDPSAMCSANLVTPRVLISAAHCGADIPEPLIVGLGVAYFGNDISDPDEEIGFQDFAYHPGYVPLDSGAGELGKFDLSVFVLEADASAEPTWFRRDAVTDDDLEAEMTSVGFGVTSAEGGGSGVKRYATLVLHDYDENFLLSMNYYNPNYANICSGDSGGPQFFFQDGFWIEGAVHSWGDQNCTVESGSTRVDIAVEWLLDRIEEVHGTRDVCEINGWYEDGVCHPFCDLPDPDCAVDTDTGTEGDAGVQDDGGAPGDGGPLADAGTGLASTGGCGCAIASSSSPAPSALFLSLIAAFLFLRRRSGV
jgi:MYXO-CTERM domain-containing protein